ncbi:unnamed protein product [Didymodactylos carnosus]|nr:unnamed protein product [Didymodactylos carnosus]CAF3799501.1 unnamed protein product [Didymodactylos carnosus]
MLISSSKLLNLDISYNKLTQLPRTFLSKLRKLRTIDISGQTNLLTQQNYQWLLSFPVRNQLSLIICDSSYELPIYLFENLFEYSKLLSIELNNDINCDCAYNILPLDKIRFNNTCNRQQKPVCNSLSSKFEQNQSLNKLNMKKYTTQCIKEYQSFSNERETVRQDIRSSNINQQLVTTTESLSSTILTNSIRNTVITTFIETSQNIYDDINIANEMFMTTTIKVDKQMKKSLSVGLIVFIIPMFLILLIGCVWFTYKGYVNKLLNIGRSKINTRNNYQINNDNNNKQSQITKIADDCLNENSKMTVENEYFCNTNAIDMNQIRFDNNSGRSNNMINETLHSNISSYSFHQHHHRSSLTIPSTSNNSFHTIHDDKEQQNNNHYSIAHETYENEQSSIKSFFNLKNNNRRLVKSSLLTDDGISNQLSRTNNTTTTRKTYSNDSLTVSLLSYATISVSSGNFSRSFSSTS